MSWNLLILAGFALRVLFHITNEAYPFSVKTPEGKSNIKKAIFSFAISCLVTYLGYFIHSDDMISNDKMLIALWGIYIAIGWAADSIFLAAMKFYEQKILKKFDKSDECIMDNEKEEEKKQTSAEKLLKDHDND